MTLMRPILRMVALAALATGAASCGDVARSGQSPMYLVVNALTSTNGNLLLSDVVVNRTAPAPCTPASPCPTTFNDTAAATFAVVPKNVAVTPTSNNSVTLTRFRVAYRRADGRNTPGVDVPYPWEGSGTVTIPGGGTGSLSFELVRHVAKEEAPLLQLRENPNVITTTADVTFYGTDRAGNDISATGSIQIDFGNFADNR